MISLSEKSGVRLHRLIRVTAYYFKVLGLAPFSYQTRTYGENSCNDSASVCFRFSKIGLVYNLSLLIMLQLSTVIAIHKSLSDFRSQSRSPVTTFVATKVTIRYVVANVVIVSSTFRQNHAVSVINRFLSIDRFLIGIEGPQKISKWTYSSLVLHLTYSAVMWFIFRATEASRVWPWFYWVFNVFASTVIYSYILGYFLMVKLIANELRRLNRSLHRLRENPGRFSGQRQFLDELSEQKAPADLLRPLLKVRTKIYELSRDVADLFSFPILLVISNYFVLFLFNAYSILFPENRDSDDQQSFNILFTRNLVSLLLIAYCVGVLFFSVTETVDQAKLTGLIIHKLLAVTTTREIKAELRQYSLQLLHERAKFTAFGFFTIDRDNLHSMMQAVITYFIMLFQFWAPKSS